MIWMSNVDVKIFNGIRSHDQASRGRTVCSKNVANLVSLLFVSGRSKRVSLSETFTYLKSFLYYNVKEGG